jgi:ADP-ribose pyrophosphatase YjhB (NUDIX family)
LPIKRLVRRLFHVGHLLTRPMTLGVRGIVINEAGAVMMVRHGYIAGWHFPGGGVGAGESCLAALKRELREEACVEIEGEPRLHGIFYNDRSSRRDHVAIYEVRAFRITGERKPNWEIREARFFPVDALPPDASAASRARLAEILNAAPIAELWSTVDGM